MRRVGKGCSGVETPLFENILQVREEDAEEEVQVSDHDHVDQENVIEEIADDQVLDKCSALVHRVEGLERLKKKDVQVKGRQADTQAKIYNIDLDHTFKVLSIQEDSEVQEVVKVVNAAKLITKVLKVVLAAPNVSTRKRKGVVIRDPEEELHDDTPAETQSAKDKG
nr:hypothetical protein [Tanacetum cinerariifolium]